MHDLYHNINATMAHASATVTATGNGDTILDLRTLGCETVTFLIPITAVAAGDATNYLTITVVEGDDSGLSDGTDVSSTEPNRLVTAGPGTTYTPLAINATGMAGTVKKLGFKVGTKRYCRLRFTETGTASATFSAVAVAHDLRRSV